MEPIFSFLQSGATIITPNKRLATEIISHYFVRNNKTVQEKPKCYPYSVFIHNLVKTYYHNFPTQQLPIPLSTTQSKYLWQQIINQSMNSPGLLDEVYEAWSRCQRWRIDMESTDFLQTPQTRQFQVWVKEFTQRLDTINGITEEQFVTFLTNQNLVNLPPTVVWYCFDEFNPEQRHLQQYFNDKGTCNIIQDINTDKKTDCYQYKAADDDDEHHQLLLWINENFKKNKSCLSIIIPNLQNQLPQIRRFFKNHFSDNDVNISLGQSLNEIPIVAHALSWLRLNKQRWSHFEARLLLSSTYLIASPHENLARAQFMQDTYMLQENYIHAPHMINELKKFSPKLAICLDNLTAYPKKASTSEWIEIFITRLKEIGFPGESPLNSNDYQSYQRLQMLLEEFKAYQVITDEMTAEEALSALGKLAQSTIFQPEGNTTAPIQIMGFLEANGCSFDGLWVTKMTDDCLPKKIRLSAFIPLWLQREKLMPYACAERELNLAKKLMMRLTHCNTSCVFSYAHISSDKANLPSPLITSLKEYTKRSFTEDSSYALENYEESYSLPLRLEEKTQGGTSLLANQAKCPFKAFAAHRLHAKKELSISEGLSASERGQIIHKVMELLWLKLSCQRGLLTIPENELETIITESIEITLQPYKKSRKYSFPTSIHSVEISRLKRLIFACLEWEKQRPYFEVEELEKLHTLNLGGLTIQIRIDRLDKCRDGTKWILDYKTAIPTTLPWREDRPKEPQLLLYSLLDKTIQTLLFTGLKEGQVTYKGLSAESHDDLPGITPIKKEEQWHFLRDTWQTQLESLAQEFTNGVCLPNPANSSICQQCDFKRLCRYNSECV